MSKQQTNQTTEKGKRLNVYADTGLVKLLEKQYKKEAKKHLTKTSKPLSYSAFLKELIEKGLSK